MRDLNVEELGHVYGAGSCPPAWGRHKDDCEKERSKSKSKQHNQQEASKSKSKEHCNYATT